MDMKTLEQLLYLLDHSEEIRPAIKSITEKLQSFGPEVKAALLPLLIGMADLRVATFNRYLELDMSREEALAMSCADINAMNRIKAKN